MTQNGIDEIKKWFRRLHLRSKNIEYSIKTFRLWNHKKRELEPQQTYQINRIVQLPTYMYDNQASVLR